MFFGLETIVEAAIRWTLSSVNHGVQHDAFGKSRRPHGGRT